MPIIEVSFQDNVDIGETSIVDRRIEDIRSLAHESNTIDEVEILREPEDNANRDDFVNGDMEWESKYEDS